ncbi:hypothetical protein MBLNU459_g3014t3 [Dothideomycetes sp. NU459]
MVRYQSLLAKTAALLSLHALHTFASPSVNVAIRTSFNSAPYLVELLETAAEENSTAYFPLLDRIAEGHFDKASSDLDLYNLFLQTLQDEGHITEPEDLSSFKFALSLHSAAPRIEAHYQFYNTSAIQDTSYTPCESWVYFDGQQYCTADLAGASGIALTVKTVSNLPFDRILGGSDSKRPSVLYADITSLSFRQFHKTISSTAKAGETSYRVRYRPSSSSAKPPVSVSGYGVELTLKRTDYIVIDDRQAGDTIPVDSKQAPEGALVDDDVSDLKPLSASELLRLDMKASSFVMDSSDPLNTLLRLTQDFPKHSAAMSAGNVSEDFRKEHLKNRETFLPAGYNIIWINGVQILAKDFEAFAMLEHLRRERRLINSAKELGLTSGDAVKLLSHSAIADSSSQQEPQRYDWRDESDGRSVIMWLNNIEEDKRYAEWPSSNRALLQRTYPGQLPPVRKDVHNLVFPVDFADFRDVQLVVENLQNFVQRKVPIRFGLVPQTNSEHATNQAKVVYHLLDTYGLGVALGYLEKVWADQGRKILAPVQSIFDNAVLDRKLRRDRSASSLQQVLQDQDLGERLKHAQQYLLRLGVTGNTPPFFVNGVPIQKGEDWLQEMSNRVTVDSRLVQQAVFEEKFGEESYIPEFFLTGASLRRNPWVVPDDEDSIRHVHLTAALDLAENRVGSIPGILADEGSIELEMIHLVVIADFDSEAGVRALLEATAFRKGHDNVALFFAHSSASPLSTSSFAVKVYKALALEPDVSLSNLERLAWTEDSASTDDEVTAAQTFWSSSETLLSEAGFPQGKSGILLNGRIVGPMPSLDGFGVDDFETLLAYERKKRLVPAAAAIKSLQLTDKASTPLSFAKLSNLIALSSVSDVPAGMFEAAPTIRTDLFNQWESAHTVIVTGEASKSSIHIVAAVDPASETAQRWVPILKVLSELDGIYMRLYLNPRERLDELPVKRFYRHVLSSKPTFDDKGVLKDQGAHFAGLPAEALLTMAMDVPPAWLVAPKDTIYDLDNVKLSSVKGNDIDAIYELESILIEGHSRDVTLGPPPRGAQLVLGTAKDTHFADTIIMANLGYFQFKTGPGFYNLTLQKGRSEEIFHIDSAGTQGYAPQPGDANTEIALTSFRGVTLFPRLSRNPGQEEEDVLESSKKTVDDLANKADALFSKIGLGGVKTGDYLSKAHKIGSNLFSGGSSSTTDVQTMPHADINIFSVASGHLYERMLNIMMVSVMKHTSHTVKFWFIEQFLSPSFKEFLPALAEEYGFRYEMVTYKWPHWLRSQKEKQREIWGYKILFLDVLFPLDLDKVIFVDADQIVRTDMYELVQYDLKGAPYGFTPMCDSRTEMEGFRFWKQGYWKNFLRGLPYHISALYVVDLVRFRQIAAGDRLRQQYHQLSADPASLSNLDQDLPNHMQHVLPIHSLPQEWLWCETWCSDESLGVARTIDLCNNPQTKEPKLDRARRQVPEWTIYDNEIAAVIRRKSGSSGSGPIAGDTQAEMQRQEAEAVKEEQQRAKKTAARDEL